MSGLKPPTWWCRSPPLWAISRIPPRLTIAHGVGSYKKSISCLLLKTS
jgi:hypothetical protein